MDTTASVGVLHGLSDYKKIRDVQVVVRDDADSVYSVSPYFEPPLFSLYHALSVSNITIVRASTSIFDSVNYDSTSFNRGFIKIMYEG
jgi:hypothetical protein